MQTPDYFTQIYPRDMAAWERLHSVQLVDPMYADALARLNQSAIIDTDLYEGVEGWDYQNPYVWQSRQLLTVSTLDANYGILGDTAASVTLNVQHNAGILGGV